MWRILVKQGIKNGKVTLKYHKKIRNYKWYWVIPEKNQAGGWGHTFLGPFLKTPPEFLGFFFSVIMCHIIQTYSIGYIV